MKISRLFYKTARRCIISYIILISSYFSLFGQINFENHTIDSSFNSFFIKAFDFDNDGDFDILSGMSQLAIYKNNGHGSFSKVTVAGNLSALWSIYPFDINRDGKNDLLVALSGTNEIGWYEQTSNWHFTYHVIDNNFYKAESVAACDFDGDGDIDIVGVSWGDGNSGGKLAWWENNGNNSFYKHMLDNSFIGGHKVEVADIDGDGDKDIIACSASNKGLVIWKNSGNGNFSRQIICNTGGLAISLFDFDQNGSLDIIFTEHANGKIILFLNDGQGNFSRRTLASNLEWPTFASPGDVNNDGFIDFAVVTRDGGNLFLFENERNWNFKKILIADNLIKPFMVNLSDLDGDGNDDVVTGTYSNRKLWWWKSVLSPIQDNVVIDSPNGGENWLWGTTHSIKWHTTGSISSVRIEYSSDGGNTWQTIVNDYSNSGTYAWAIPNDFSNNCMVRVIDASSSSIYDLSDNPFTISGLKITGHAFYDNSENPIPNVTLTMTGSLEKVRKSDLNGYFSFSPLLSNSNYVLSAKKARKEDVGRATIEAYDAALAARYSVGLQDLGFYGKLAADVNNDGQILMYDAANIARYSVGLPIPSNILIGDWVFTPADTELSMATSDISNVSFRGIIKGDVNANWAYSGSSLEKKAAFCINSFVDSYDIGDTVTVAIHFPGFSVLSVALNLTFDSNVYELLNITDEQKANAFEVFTNVVGNTIRLAGFSPKYIQTDSDFLKFQFKKKPSGSESLISITKLCLNGEPLGFTTLVAKKSLLAPKAFELSKNYPNPFNATTRCAVKLPQNGQLQVSVYNLLGAKILDLANQYFYSGKYSFNWNGHDWRGRIVPSGVYLIIAKYKNHVQKNKIIFVK